jgi:hypothetical protein
MLDAKHFFSDCLRMLIYISKFSTMIYRIFKAMDYFIHEWICLEWIFKNFLQ